MRHRHKATALFIVLLAASLLGVAGATAAPNVPCEERPACRGCGCKGGPGYRDLSTNRCVGFKDLGAKCGDPPQTHLCRFENAPGTGENFWCALDLPANTPNPHL